MTEIPAQSQRGTQGIPNIINQIQTMQTALQKMHQRLRGPDRYANAVGTRLHILSVGTTSQNCTLVETLNI